MLISDLLLSLLICRWEPTLKSPVLTLFYFHFPLLPFKKISTSAYPYISFLKVVGWKKACFNHFNWKKWWIWSKGHFMILNFLETTVIFWVSINHPKPIFKELFNLQLWAPTFFQYGKLLFHLPLSICLLCPIELCIDFLQSSLMQLEVCMSDIGPKQ